MTTENGGFFLDFQALGNFFGTLIRRTPPLPRPSHFNSHLGLNSPILTSRTAVSQVYAKLARSIANGKGLPRQRVEAEGLVRIKALLTRPK